MQLGYFLTQSYKTSVEAGAPGRRVRHTQSALSKLHKKRSASCLLGRMSSQEHNISHSLASLRYIRDINEISYPSGVHGPDPELNKDARDGKFRCVNISIYIYSVMESWI